MEKNIKWLEEQINLKQIDFKINHDTIMELEKANERI